MSGGAARAGSRGQCALFTSYWSSPLLRDMDAVKVSISRGVPRWPLPFTYKRVWELAPNAQTWALRGALEGFEASYLEQLERIGPAAILARLEEVSQGRPVILLCWEKPDEPCHRRMFAEWIEMRTGLVVPELRPGAVPR